jgi:hypothetical protein
MFKVTTSKLLSFQSTIFWIVASCNSEARTASIYKDEGEALQ